MGLDYPLQYFFKTLTTYGKYKGKALLPLFEGRTEMVKLLLRSLFLFGSAIHLSVHASGRTENEGAYELKTHDDIMKMKVGGALFITVPTELQGNSGLYSA